MQRRWLSLILAGTVSLAAADATAISLSDITHETFWTTFLDTGGNVGEAYAPTPDQNPIGTVATFGSPGAVAFMNNPPYYLVDPLAWGFAGQARADISFSVGMASISIAVRGTANNNLAGPAAVYPFAPNTVLVRAEGFVAALDMSGEIIAGSETTIQRRGLKSALLNEIAFTGDSLGQPIYGVAFVQTVDSTAAGIMVGGIGITPLPAPGAAWLLAPAVLALGRLGSSTHGRSSG